VVTEEKRQLRSQVDQLRTKRSAAELIQADQKFAQIDWDSLLPGTAVGCYLSMTNEPPTGGLIDAISANGKTVYVPKLTADSKLRWGLNKPPMIKNKFGVLEPEHALCETESLTAIIIPALCVDRDGNRLGRGAGYFDRTLAAVEQYALGGPKRVALVFDEEVLDAIPHDALDQSVDLIVTPKRIFEVETRHS